MTETASKPTKLELYEIAMRCPDTTGPEKAVLGALLSHADPDGTNAHPGNTRLATYAGVSPRRVQDILKALRAKGWAERTEVGSRSAKATHADVYAVILPADRTDPEKVLRGDATGSKVPVGGGESGAPTGGRPPVTPQPTGSFVQNPPEENFRTPGPHTRSLNNIRSPEPTASTKATTGNKGEHLPADWEPNAIHRRQMARTGADSDWLVAEFRYRMNAENRTDWDRTFGHFINVVNEGREDEEFPLRDDNDDHHGNMCELEPLPMSWQRPEWLTERGERSARALAGSPSDDELAHALMRYLSECETSGRAPNGAEFPMITAGYLRR